MLKKIEPKVFSNSKMKIFKNILFIVIIIGIFIFYEYWTSEALNVYGRSRGHTRSGYTRSLFSVRFHDQKLKGIDPITIKPLQYNYFKDIRGVYSLNMICEFHFRGFDRIEGANSKSFEVIGYDWGKDKNNVYYHSSIVDGADPEFFELIGKDGIFGATSYAKDNNHIYYRDSILDNVDPKTFVFLERGYAKDINNVYKNGEVLEKRYENGEVLEKRDPETFEVINYEYTKDKNHVYKNDKIIAGTNPETFQL